MTTANVHDAKTNLSKLLNAAADGERVVITRRGGKVTEFNLVPVTSHKKLPLFGALKGKIIYTPDYDKADTEILRMFEKSAQQG